ncbi:MAG: D-alanyl-D-alanine carboxypeptidase [Rhodobacterales bacterium]|nr:MAG: D-alanyl-D-alanine carboxypeptidase [Rhodobacterales bacterium]
MFHRLIVLTIALLGLASLASAQSFTTSARAAYVYDMTTGTVLLEKNADQPLPPASMSKLMTLYMAFEAVADGRLSPDERLPVSEHAMSYGGSTMFLDTTDRVRVEDLLLGVIVLSGNDASAVLAEALSTDGTEAGFARMMTEKARELGMTNSTFANSNGWPASGHRMSVRDLGILAQHIISDFPTFYPLFAQQTFAFDGRAPQNVRNRNPLLGLGIGADGLKTGHTEEAGYGLVGSAKQGDRRVVFVLSGLPSTQARAEESEKIVNWAFRQFVQKAAAPAGTRVAEAEVWMGETATVPLMLEDDLTLLVPATQRGRLESEVVFEGPIKAPITEGDTIAELVVKLDGLPEVRRPLVAAQSVGPGGFKSRMTTAAQVLIRRFQDAPQAPAVIGPGADS